MILARRRWWIVGASAIGLMCSGGPVNIFTFGVFLRPITEEFGIGRGTFGSAMLITSWISTLSGPFLGMLLDRWGARRILLPAILLFALATAAQALMTASLLVIYLLFALKGLMGAGQSPVAYALLVAKWFDRQRGLALGIAMAGVGLGTSVIPLLAAHLIGDYGWRLAYVGLGITILLLAGVPVALFVRDPVEAEPARAADHAALSLPGITMAQAVRGWRFWALIVAFLLGVVALNGVLTQIVAILMDRGVALQAATGVLAASGIAALFGRILSGWCLDRFFGPYVAVAVFILPMIGSALFASGAGGAVPLAGALLCGCALGAEVDLMAFFISRYFGLRSYGKIFGTLFGFFAGATGVGPFLSGLSFDLYHSYVPAFALYDAGLVIACLLVLPLGPYPFPAQLHPRAAARRVPA